MEVFVDFGLFEILIAMGLAAVARLLYSRIYLAFGVLLASVLLPIVLVFLVPDGPTKYVAVASLGTSLVNAIVIFGVLKMDAMRTVLGGLGRTPGHSKSEGE